MEPLLLVGVDWDPAGYEVCLLDPSENEREQLRVEHSAEEIGGFIEGLLKRVNGAAQHIAVAIEQPRGALIDGLLEREIAVYAINPKQLERLRDRHNVAGAKDDPRDAYVLADSLRHDRHLFHRVHPDHALVVELRAVTHADEELATEYNRLTNRVREQVHRTHPHLLKLSSNVSDPWVWELLELMLVRPHVRVNRSRLESLLGKYHIRRIGVDEVLEIVQQPPLRVAAGTLNAVRAQLALLLPRLRLVHQQRQACAKQMSELLTTYAQESETGKAEQPSTTEILLSFPGVGVRVASTLLAEASHQLSTAEAAVSIRAYGGAAPVTRRSGKRVAVVRRYACNARLQNALFHWARTSVQNDANAKSYYAALRARGHSHGRALRSVADRWLRILVSALRTRSFYDPGRLRAQPGREPTRIAA
jgi:transposase